MGRCELSVDVAGKAGHGSLDLCFRERTAGVKMIWKGLVTELAVQFLFGIGLIPFYRLRRY